MKESWARVREERKEKGEGCDTDGREGTAASRPRVREEGMGNELVRDRRRTRGGEGKGRGGD